MVAGAALEGLSRDLQALAVELTERGDTKPEYFVSYARGDHTPEGQQRELIVDQFCAAVEKRGINILRDKNVLGLGERISKFMQRIGRGKRVFVVLSNKYLKSHFCMYELHELWKYRRQDDEDFLRHVRVYTLPGTEIWTPLERARCAVYWREECGKIEAIFKEHGFDILGKTDAQKYLLMKEFSNHISEILATVTDILQPRDFEQLIKYGFSDGPIGGSASES
jgi:internalin A